MEKALSSRVTYMEKALSSSITDMEKTTSSRVTDMEKVSSFRVTDMEKHNDPFSFIMDGSQISHSQEELLRHQPFVGEVNQPSHPSTTSGADLITMMSMLQTQPTEKDSPAPKD